MIYLVHGQNGLATEERTSRLRADLDTSGFGSSVLDVTTTSVQDIEAAVHAAPFFGGHRTVVIRGPASLGLRASNSGSGESEDLDEFGAQLRNSGNRKLEWRDVVTVLLAAPDTTDVICWIGGTLPSTHPLSKAGKDAGWKNEVYRIPRGAELMAWVSGRVSGMNGEISPDAVEVLLDLLYPTLWKSEGRWETATIDMRVIATELDKLDCASNAGRIDRAVVEELVADRGGYSAFRLTDQIFSGQIDVSLVELDNVLGSGEPAERVVAQLTSDVALRWTIRSTADFSADEVAAALKTSAGRVTTGRNKGVGNDSGTLASASEELRHLDWSVKTGRCRDSTSAIVPLVASIASRFVRRPASGNQR